MDHYASFITNITQKVALPPGDLDAVLDAFKPVKIKKRQFIVQPGFVARYRHYVVQGAFRAYVIDEKGNDCTIQFAIDDWWITDYNSYIYQTPATSFIVALEDSLILRIDYQQEQQLKASSHPIETLFRMMAEKTAAFFARRIISSLTQDAAQRYHEFLQQFPSVVQRLPQYAIASYLNMSTEFLSRIKNEKTKKKKT
jgi:CRP-like cAMP-binding protein